MASKWKYPRVGEAWAECQWCGQDYPASQVWLNPRFGFQCYKCWDGIIQRDQILQPIFPGEGTRRTIDPVTNTLLQGTDATSAEGLEPTYTYFLADRATGDTYEVFIPPMLIIPTGVIVYFTTSEVTVTATSTTELVHTGIHINNGWAIYVLNGVIATEQVSFGETGILFGICDFGEIPRNCVINLLDFGSGFTYVVDFDESPPTVTFTETPSGTVFNGVQIGNGYYVVLNGELTAYTSPPPSPVYANDCVDVTAEIESGEIPVVDNPPPDVVPPFVPTETIAVDERWQDLFSTLTTVLVDERWTDAFPIAPTEIVDERWQS